MRTDRSVLFFRLKRSLIMPSHSTKFTGGGGFFSSIRTTRDSTFGGGRKLFFPTFISWSTLASNCVFTESLQYIASPGLAERRSANSSCSNNTAHRNVGRWESNLKTIPDEIWYGMLATQISKKGHLVFIASPWITCSFDSSEVFWTRLITSRTILLSYSRATTFLAFCSNGMVMFPVPGPISRTVSVALTADLCTMAVTTAGFFRKC
mmetsp:Transcript_10934/g.30205  ORF Transcript_10934/g.30205 Transcript_10934/m.30205 type:complete len:208 (+) Transcript_10934:606-1229(+)